MARLPGRNGRLYLDLTGAGSATPVAFISQWTLNLQTNKIDVTAMGDAGQVQLSGLPQQDGSFNGFYDDATVQMYTAASDGLSRKFYLYPNTLTNLQYFFGTAIFDMTITGSVAGAFEISGNFANTATTGILKQG
jgi:hypothetical protein